MWELLVDGKEDTVMVNVRYHGKKLLFLESVGKSRVS